MSDPGLFIAGLIVTLIVASAIALLVYAAVLDGRYDAERRSSTVAAPEPIALEPVPAAERPPGDTLAAA